MYIFVIVLYIKTIKIQYLLLVLKFIVQPSLKIFSLLNVAFECDLLHKSIKSVVLWFMRALINQQKLIGIGENTDCCLP